MRATTTAAAEPRQGRAASTRWALPGRWGWPAAFTAGALLLFFAVLRLAGTQPVKADAASNALQAWQMLHGNPLLHGWWLTDVSFYTTELPQFMLVELVAGLRPEVAHICAALTYTLLVVLAAFVARGRSRGAEGTVRALLAAGIMLAPAPGETAWALLLTPNHTGTGVPVLLLLLLVDLAPRRWYTAVAAGVLLAWALVGDPLILVIGVLPVVVVCLARACLALRTGGCSGTRSRWPAPPPSRCPPRTRRTASSSRSAGSPSARTPRRSCSRRCCRRTSR